MSKPKTGKESWAREEYADCQDGFHSPAPGARRFLKREHGKAVRRYGKKDVANAKSG